VLGLAGCAGGCGGTALVSVTSVWNLLRWMAMRVLSSKVGSLSLPSDVSTVSVLLSGASLTTTPPAPNIFSLVQATPSTGLWGGRREAGGLLGVLGVLGTEVSLSAAALGSEVSELLSLSLVLEASEVSWLADGVAEEGMEVLAGLGAARDSRWGLSEPDSMICRRAGVQVR
jgi:hypothetical protein